MQHKEIVINEQKVAYYESGDKGQPILFIHGNSMSGLCFAQQVESTLGERYRLVAMDLPGHGKSAPARHPGSGYTLPGYADMVCAFAKSLKLENAVLVGWSLGGHVLLEAIGRLQTSAGLMIFGAPPVGKPMAADAFLPNPLMSLAFKSDLSADEAAALTAAFFKPGTGIPQFFYDDLKRTDGSARETLGMSIGTGNYADEVTIAAECNKPLAIVHGEMDPLINLSYLRTLGIPALWGAEIQIIPDAGHTPHWEQPERFNRLLIEFIEDCIHGDRASG